MRFARLIPAAFVVCFAGAALAQAEWAEFVDRDDHFTVNFPGEPDKKDLQYKTADGATLPGHVYSAEDRRGQYLMTVIDYRNANEAQRKTAIEEASKAFRAKGKVTYDEPGRLDGHLSQRITVETPEGRRWLAEILMSNDHRLYISEAGTALTTPPPAQFQASIQVLNDNGVRIRYNGGQEKGVLADRPGN
jgi:hypothetical protein